jgi:type III pantothenate kinase
MNVVVDYGNSFAKVGVFRNYELLEQYAFDQPDELKKYLQNFSADNFILSSVTHDTISVLDWAAHIRNKYILTSSLPLPITNLYGTPETLGMDRVAAACGAQQRFPTSACLVIDAGTCIKYDFVDNQKCYHGGAISPGLRMRLLAMHTLTAKLPLVELVNDPPLIGNTTAECLQSGAINGMTEEINGIIQQYQRKFEGLRVILCGGDGRFFENKVKAPIFAIPELVLSGLNSILIYNVGG